MRVTHLLLENYRSFYGRHELPLKPLTLLYGYNHSGKSALLRALALLGESSGGRYSGPLALESDAGRGAGWDDLRSQTQRVLDGLGLGIKVSRTMEEEGHDITELFFRFDHDLDHRQIYTRELSIGSGDRIATAEFTLKEQAGRLQLVTVGQTQRDSSGERTLTPVLPALDPRTLAPDLGRLLWETRAGSKPIDPAIIDFLFAERILSSLADQFQWLSSVRACPPRRTQLRPVPPARMAPNGEGAVQLLARDSLGDSSLLRRVQDFYQKLTYPGRFYLNLQVRSDEAMLTLTPGANPLIQVNLVDAGEGLAQVFSVLLALAQAERASPRDPTLLLLEQPELHLHPRAEQLLGQTLCEVVSNQPQATLVVETHSEVLLLSIFEAILKKELNPEQVGLCWVRQDTQGRSTIDKVLLDALARPGNDWPPNAFNEVAELSMRVGQLRRKQSQS